MACVFMCTLTVHECPTLRRSKAAVPDLEQDAYLANPAQNEQALEPANASIVMQQTEVHQASVADALTGLMNKKWPTPHSLPCE